MIKNYFKIAWRNILRQKGYAGINIVGLAIGIAACLLILQYVAFELSYENFHTNRDRIYRVQQDRYDAGKLSTQWAAGAYAAGNTFKESIPEIEEYVKLTGAGQVVAEVNDQPVKISKVFFATNSFFSVFTYPLLSGNKESALTEPFKAALSETTARTLFGTTNVVGKPLRLNRNSNYTITAVYKDAPVNTQLRPDILLSYATFLKFQGTDNNPETAWYWDGCLTYLLLRKGADPAVVEKKFVPIVDKQAGEGLKQFNASVTYLLQPLKDIHLYSHYMMEPGPTGDGKTTYLLLGIAFFIAIIAWVNYINLATARAVNRAKEVGIRKTVGSQRRQLIAQFLSESAVLNFLALVLALLIVVVAIPGFNKISGQQLSFSLLAKSNFWLSLAALFVIGVFFSGLYPAFVLSGFKPIEVLKGKMVATRQGSLLRKSLVVFQFAASLFLLIGTVIGFDFSNVLLLILVLLVCIVTGLIAGSYPAFYLSSFLPVRVLKGVFRQGKGAVSFRKVLVVSQFAISIGLIVGTAIVFQQINHAKNRSLGYNPDNLISIVASDDLKKNYAVVKQDLLNTGYVESISKASQPMTRIYNRWSDFSWEGKDPNADIALDAIMTEWDFEKTSGLKFTQGRPFSIDHKTDSNAVIINEEALKVIGYKDPVGKTMQSGDRTITIVGVVENVLIDDPFKPVYPLAILFNANVANNIFIRLKPSADLQQTLKAIQPIFSKYNPSLPFEYSFVDEEFNKKFTTENQVGKLAGIFASLAIFISCLGLFGLAMFMAERRTKEISIRKVLGASTIKLWALLSKEFVLLVALGCVIASPLAFLLMKNWLQKYEYRIDISWWLFVIAGLLATVIALITVSTQAIKAAIANPVKSLRTE